MSFDLFSDSVFTSVPFVPRPDPPTTKPKPTVKVPYKSDTESDDVMAPLSMPLIPIDSEQKLLPQASPVQSNLTFHVKPEKKTRNRKKSNPINQPDKRFNNCKKTKMSPIESAILKKTLVRIPELTFQKPPSLMFPQIAHTIYLCRECWDETKKIPVTNKNSRMIMPVSLCNSCVGLNSQIVAIYMSAMCNDEKSE